MSIRPELPGDIQAIHQVQASAFPTPAEADLVNILRRNSPGFLSLVDVDNDGLLTGHILFTPVQLSNNPDKVSIAGLAPMAVRPALQNKGLGSQLVQAGLKAWLAGGYEAAVVLGHPGFYSRFGFLPSLEFNIDSQYDVPAEVFMAQELTPGILARASGRIQYHPDFDGL